MYVICGGSLLKQVDKTEGVFRQSDRRLNGLYGERCVEILDAFRQTAARNVNGMTDVRDLLARNFDFFRSWILLCCPHEHDQRLRELQSRSRSL